MTAKNLGSVEFLFGVAPKSMYEVKNVQRLEKMKVQNAFLSMSAFETTAMSMKACHANEAVTSGGNVVLRDAESMSTKEWIDPGGVIELRAKLLLKRDLSGTGSQGV